MRRNILTVKSLTVVIAHFSHIWVFWGWNMFYQLQKVWSRGKYYNLCIETKIHLKSATQSFAFIEADTSLKQDKKLKAFFDSDETDVTRYNDNDGSLPFENIYSTISALQ